MAVTIVEWGPCRSNNLKLGTNSSTKYTVVVGTLVYVGTDGDSNTNRWIPCTDVSAHRPNGISLMTTAQTAYTDGILEVQLFPMQILTNNVGVTPPVATADNLVYPVDANYWASADTNSCGFSMGTCLEAIAAGDLNGYFRLQLTGY